LRTRSSDAVELFVGKKLRFSKNDGMSARAREKWGRGSADKGEGLILC